MAASKANVTSIEALEAFRAKLIIFLSKARPTLEEVTDDVLRTRVWLETDQRNHWEHQLRRRQKDLEEAQQALFSASIAKLRAVSDAERMAVVKAKRALTAAEEKLAVIKRWRRDFDSQVEPLSKQLDSLRTMLATDLPKAVAFMTEIVKALDAYAKMTPGVSLGGGGGGEAGGTGGEAQPMPEQAASGVAEGTEVAGPPEAPVPPETPRSPEPPEPAADQPVRAPEGSL